MERRLMGSSRVLRRWFFVILLGLSLGFYSPAHAQPTVRETAKNEASKILDQVDVLKAKVEEIRGLKYRAGVKKGLQSPQAFRAFLNQSIEKEYPEKKLYAWKRWLVHFGFM